MVAIGRLLNGAARLIFDPKFSEVATKTLRSSKQAMGYSKFGRQVKDAFVAAESKTSASIWKNMGNSIKEFPSDITSAAKKPGLWNATKAVGGQVLKRLPLIFGVWAIGSELPTIYEAFKDKGLVGGVIETAKSAVNVLSGFAGFVIGQALCPIPIVGGLLGAVGASIISSTITGSRYKDQKEEALLAQQQFGQSTEQQVQNPNPFTPPVRSTVTPQQLMAMQQMLYGGGLTNPMDQDFMRMTSGIDRMNFNAMA